MHVETINGIDTDKLVYAVDDRVVDGNVIFRKPVHVQQDLSLGSGILNGIRLRDEIIESDKHYDGE